MQIKHLRSEVDPNSTTAVQEYYYQIIELNTKYGWDANFNPFLYEVFIAYNPRLDELAGFGCIGEQPDGTANVLRYDLVDPMYRGMHLQQKLIGIRTQYLKGQGHKTAQVFIAPENCYSLNNYVASGFRFDQPELRAFKNKLYQSLSVKLI